MAQAAVAGVAADAVAEKAMQKTIEFLDQDVISWSKQKTTVKVSPDGRREVEETTKWSAGVKVWELGIALLALTIWEGLQILQQDLSQLDAVGSWIESALTTMGSDVESGFQTLGIEEAKLFGTNVSENRKKLPSMPAMSAMGVLDAQLGVLFAQVLAPLNLSGGQVINGLIAQLSKGAPRL